MIKIFKHIKHWNKWRTFVLSDPLHKFLVLIGLRKDITFDWIPTDQEEKQIQEMIEKLEKR